MMQNSLHQLDKSFNDDVVFDAIDTGIIVLNHNGEVVIWNAWMSRYSYLERNQVAGNRLVDIFPDMGKRLQQAVQDALSRGLSSIISARLHQTLLPLFCSSQDFQHNRRIHQSISVTPLKMHKKPWCLLQIRDMSRDSMHELSLKQATLELETLASRAHEQESQLQTILNNTLDAIIILNRLGPSFPREKTVFLSVHADSLHPSVRGSMIYVPSRYLRPEEPYTVKRRDIKAYAEYRNHPTVRLGADFKARVEASSRYLATNIVSSLETNDIKVHPYEPVRDRVLRGRSAWVPAVLRYTAAQNAVLVEACNMANAGDRALLLQASWREEFAKAVVEGVAEAFAN